MNGQVLVAGIFGAVIGGSVTFQAVQRNWWAASGQLAIGANFIADFATSGNHSRTEHAIVLWVSIVLLILFGFSMYMHHKTKRDDQARKQFIKEIRQPRINGDGAG